MDRSDQELILAFREDGDEEAITTLVNRYADPLYNFIWRLMGRSQEAEDLTQEAFMKMWKNLSRYDMSRGFKTWLFTIGRNVAIDYLRKKQPMLFSRLKDNDEDRSFEDTLSDDAPLADELFNHQIEVLELQKALESLSVDERTIITLKDGEEFTFEEIAEVLGRPMNTIKSRYRRALLKLRAILAPK